MLATKRSVSIYHYYFLYEECGKACSIPTTVTLEILLGTIGNTSYIYIYIYGAKNLLLD